MAVDPKKLIAAIAPDLYCDDIPNAKGKRLSEEVKQVAKKEGYLKAAEIAKLRESSYLDLDFISTHKTPFDYDGLKHPIEQHRLVYDAFSQNLEPIYFWILDFVNGFYGGSEKLIDNFVASEGSGYFGEMQARATRMQDEGTKILVNANNVLRSVLNLVYDLKEFKLRLRHYDDMDSKDAAKVNAATLSLKQIWLDSVDAKRGTSSIKGFAQQFEYVTLIDAFMAARGGKELDKLDLNDRVKRILQQRLPEFERWVVESRRELTKRFEIEKKYLRSQVNSLKLYSRWAKPYLKAARKLEQQAERSSDLVTNFNTAVFELVLMAKGKYDPSRDVSNGDLPKSFGKVKARKYVPIALVEFRFRSVPDRTQQQGGGYTYRGKAEISFTSFALNEDELKIFKQEIERDDLAEVYQQIEGATEESLGEVLEDINLFLEEGDETTKKKKVEDDTNPFSALFSFFQKGESGKKKDLSDGIAKDSYYEKVFRSQAVLDARRKCRKLYDTYKKVHDMPAFPASLGYYAS